MSFGDIMTTEYWGVPLWGWILIIILLVAIIVGIRSAMAKKGTATSKEVDPEAAVQTTETQLATTTQDFPRDAPLPPPAPSETSRKG